MTTAFTMLAGEDRAPAPVADRVTDELLQQRTIAIYGNAAHLPRLVNAPDLEYLWISGVNLRAAEALSQLTHLPRLAIYNYRLRDLKPLAPLVNLEHLLICGCSFVRSLTGLESLMRLKRLLLFQLTDYRTIQPLSELTAIEALCIQGAWSKNLRIDTLQPLAALTRLDELCLAAIRVTDKSLRPLHDLHRLRHVFISDVFPKEEFLALAQALPNARGEWLDTYRAGRRPGVPPAISSTNRE